MLEITSKQRKILEKAAHNLDPIVIIGQNGVTDSLVQMVLNSLKAHELIKVKFNEYKEDRAEYANEAHFKTVRNVLQKGIYFRGARTGVFFGG